MTLTASQNERRAALGLEYPVGLDLDLAFHRAMLLGLYAPSMLATTDIAALPNALGFDLERYKAACFKHDVRAFWGRGVGHGATWPDDSGNDLTAAPSGGVLAHPNGVREFDGEDDHYVCPENTIDQDFADRLGLSGTPDGHGSFLPGGGWSYLVVFRSIDVANRWLFKAFATVGRTRLFLYTNADKKVRYVFAHSLTLDPSMVTPANDLHKTFDYVIPEHGGLIHIGFSYGRLAPNGQTNETPCLVVNGQTIFEDTIGNQIPPNFLACQNCALFGSHGESSPAMAEESDIRSWHGQGMAACLIAGGLNAAELKAPYIAAVTRPSSIAVMAAADEDLEG